MEPGFNKIGNRDVDLDVIPFDEVKSIDEGHFVITNNELNPVGTISEQSHNNDGLWMRT